MVPRLALLYFRFRLRLMQRTPRAIKRQTISGTVTPNATMVDCGTLAFEFGLFKADEIVSEVEVGAGRGRPDLKDDSPPCAEMD